MLIEILIALLLGVTAGTLTGLAPGIHINLVSAFLVLSLSSFSSIPAMALAVFITAMSITHTFVDFIPSIYLGAPEEDSFLSVLPGHEMLKEGKAHEAFMITLFGSLAAIIIILLISPIYIITLPVLFPIIKSIIPFILIFISLFLIFREKNYTLSLIIFLLAGILGYLAFNLPITQPLTPLLSGLFGISALIISIKSKPVIQQQKITKIKEIIFTKSDFLKSIAAIFISSPFCSFLPGIGSGHAATIGSEIIPQSKKGFLFLVGATNTIVMGLSFITLYAINKSRSGSAAAISSIIPSLKLSHLLIILAAIIISGILASIISYNLSKLAAKNISRFSYTKLTIIVIFFIILINFFFTNWHGILLLITSASLGIFTILSGSRRINMMGALIIPAIIYYLTF